ncbi:AAA family ATPase [Streptomyces parvus]|uniref:helix-turn-helix transcriptional regulator n=1 Tax=Streptomyces parvus TaxID=66428 RepID=UPI003649444A
MDDSSSRSFVGRSVELGQLRRAAAAAAAGSPTVALVSGPAGIGKTTLVEEFTATLGETFTVLSLAGSAHERDTPFAAAARLLARAHRGREDSMHSSSGPGPSVLEVGTEIIEALDTLQGPRPVLVHLDDAQDMDLSSLQAFGFVLLRLHGDRALFVIGTNQPARTVADMSLKSAGARLERVELEGFTVSEARSYVTGRLGQAPSESRAQTLVEWSEGNPLYLEAVLGALPGGLPDRLTIRMPPPLSDVVGEWARTFSPAGRRILDMLAVLDAPASVPLLSLLLHSDTVLEDAEPLAERHMVVWSQENGVPRLRLLHAGQRQALYAAMSQSERSAAHRRIAEVLEPPERWRHQVAASDTYDPGLATALRSAARQETDAGQMALAAQYSLAASQVDPSTDGRQNALLSAVRLLVITGQYRSALQHRARVTHTASGPRRSEVMGLLDFADGQDSASHTRLREAWKTYESLAERPAAATAAAESGMVACSLGLGTEALTSSAYALRHAEDEVVRGMAHANAAYGHALLGGPAEGLLQLEYLGDDAGAVSHAETDSLTHRGMLRILAGDLTGALLDLSVSARRRNWGMSRISVTAPLLYSVWCHLFLGDWRAASRTLSVAHDMAQTAGRSLDFFALHCLSAILFSFSGRTEAAEADLREAAEVEMSVDFPGPGYHLSATQAVVAFAQQDYGRTASLLEQVYEDPAHASRTRLFGLPHLPLLAIAHARNGDVAHAEKATRRLAASAGRGVMHPLACAWAEGATAVARRESEAAVHIYRAALNLPRTGGNPLLIRTFVRHDLGALLLDRGEDEQGRTALREAEAAFRGMGAERLAEASRARAGDGPAASNAARAVWEDLSDRERDVADLVARGWTNREIAAELYLSAKTVEYHLGNVYTKHGLSGRHELRDLMQERLS